MEILRDGIDKTGRPFRIEFESAMIWQFEVIAGGRRVGHAWCQVHDDVLRVNDLLIYKNAPVWNNWQKLRGYLGWGAKTEDYRGCGIGAALLAAITRQATSAGLNAIEGAITASDLRETPALTGWYKSHGFVITEKPPDAFSMRLLLTPVAATVAANQTLS